MKILIVYGTKHGFTKKCAKGLSEKLKGQCELYNLKDKSNIDLKQYDKVIIGGSIYMGQIRKEVTEFCTKNLVELKQKKIGLFICCMEEGEKAETLLNKAFSEELLKIAVCKEVFGGGFIFKNANFLERLVMKKVAKVTEDIEAPLQDNINKFVQSINSI